MPDGSPKALHVVLVHGTFAKAAAWTDPATSPLCEALKARLPASVTFEPFNWSGRNRHDDRRSAGHALAGRLAAAAEDRDVIVIGHSHGGTVITQALAVDPTLGDRLTGVVFLATPFLQLQRRPHASALAGVFGGAISLTVLLAVDLAVERALAALPVADWIHLPMRITGLVLSACALVALFWPSAAPGRGWSPWLQAAFLWTVLVPPVTLGSVAHAILKQLDWGNHWSTAGGWAMYLVAQIGTLAVSSALLPDDTKARLDRLRVSVMVDNVLEEFTVKGLVPGRTLFVRMSGDEASAGLTWVQVMSRLLTELVTQPLVLLGAVDPDRPARAEASGRHRNASRTAWLSWAILLGLVALELSGASNWLETTVDGLTTPFVSTRTALRTARQMVVDLLPVALFATALAATLAVVTLLAFGRAFGRWFLWTALFVNVSVEPVPPGRWTLWQFDASDDPNSLNLDQSTPLAHSLAYREPRVIDAVVGWIAARVGQPADTTDDRAAPRGGAP